MLNEFLTTNQAGIDLIKYCEGLHKKCGWNAGGEQLVTTYYCPSNVLTIGYGTTGSEVTEGMVITEKKAQELLRKDLEYFEQAVKRLVKIKLNANQFSALVSFTYNCGEGALGRSSALKALNRGDLKGCVAGMQLWNKGSFGVLPGLVKRRRLEGELFMSPQNAHPKAPIDGDLDMAQGVGESYSGNSYAVFCGGSLKALVNTVLKASTKDSIRLSTQEKAAIAQHQVLAIQNLEPSRDKHMKVTLSAPIGGEKTWYLFAPHWSINVNLENLL